MEYTVRIHEKGKTLVKKAEAETNLLKFLRKSSINVNSPCGGHGTCGKCKVLVTGLLEEPSKKERKYLDPKSEEKGFRLACYNQINNDIDIYIGGKKEEASIVTDAKKREISLQPVVTKKVETLNTPDLDDQRSDIERVLASAGKSRIANSLDFLRKLPEQLRSNNFAVTMVYFDDKLISIEPGDTTGRVYGVAVDIGTTTIAAYLINLLTGERVDVYSMLNPQRQFGADVISRINYTLENQGALDEMKEVITSCINQIIISFEERNNIPKSDIYAITFVGNTTMMHLLMGLPSRNIAVSPFIPVSTLMHQLPAKELGLNINPFGYAVVFPSVAAYIGADTIAAVLSSGMYNSSKISLLIDIGTNGEIVLGNSKWLYSCSVAAGPAFEGAHIRNGIGGVKGAIDKVDFNNGLELTTIGNEKAIGICGSGIVDAISGMLSRGIIDETGRIIDVDEGDQSLKAEFESRFIDIDGLSAFLLLKSDECDAGNDIAVTQRDIRELQNAKAAIAAGIKTLIKHAGIKIEDIEKVYLAGGFGSYINIDSALNIGLLPHKLKGRIESIGNAAGGGAVEGLLSTKILKKAEKLKNTIKYIELSADKDFVDEYINCMTFD